LLALVIEDGAQVQEVGHGQPADLPRADVQEVREVGEVL
jgi:hypothetical protein